MRPADGIDPSKLIAAFERIGGLPDRDENRGEVATRVEPGDAMSIVLEVAGIVREWGESLGAPELDLPYEETDENTAELINQRMRERFGGGEELSFADHVLARGVTLDVPEAGIKLAGVILEFQVGIDGQAPAPVSTVCYNGDSETMRKFGKLVRDTANGAARAAEGKARR